MVEAAGQHSNHSEESFKKEALLRAIAERKKEDPMVGLKLGSKELVQRLLSGLKNEKGVHIESLLAILGSLAGYACHMALRDEFIVGQKKAEKEVFVIVTDKAGNRYYMGDAVNSLVVGGSISIWSLVGGTLQHMGVSQLPDIAEIFSRVASTVGTEKFGVPNVLPKHKPGDLPFNYVKSMWPALLPLMDDFCDSSRERPIMLGMAIQQAIEMGKDVIKPETAAKLVMECAIPMSKIGPEWLNGPLRQPPVRKPAAPMSAATPTEPDVSDTKSSVRKSVKPNWAKQILLISVLTLLITGVSADYEIGEFLFLGKIGYDPVFITARTEPSNAGNNLNYSFETHKGNFTGKVSGINDPWNYKNGELVDIVYFGGDPNINTLKSYYFGGTEIARTIESLLLKFGFSLIGSIVTIITLGRIVGRLKNHL